MSGRELRLFDRTMGAIAYTMPSMQICGAAMNSRKNDLDFFFAVLL
jgi:hypothetical protein